MPRYSLGQVTLAPVPWGVTFLLMYPVIPFMVSSFVVTRFTFLGIIGLIALLELYIFKVYALFREVLGMFSHSLICHLNNIEPHRLMTTLKFAFIEIKNR